MSTNEPFVPQNDNIDPLEQSSLNQLAEQKLLKLSVFVTLAVALFGVIMGIITNSSSIIFDGVYSSVDCFFSLAALLVVRLIHLDSLRLSKRSHQLAERFQFGFWHLEPMVLAINGISLSIAVLYGLFEAINSIWNGGQVPSFDYAILYALIAVIVCFGLAFYEAQRNKEIQSEFIAMDIKGWIISGCLSLAILIAFLFAFAINETSYIWLIPYIDPVILALICLAMAPMPLRVVLKALKEVFLITPRSLDAHITNSVDEIVLRHNFVSAQTYVAKVGRSTMIEIHIIVPQDWRIDTIAKLDAIREEISEAIGDAGPDRWLTVSFTGLEDWAV